MGMAVMADSIFSIVRGEAVVIIGLGAYAVPE
jgi:hypothetical protein